MMLKEMILTRILHKQYIAGEEEECNQLYILRKLLSGNEGIRKAFRIKNCTNK